MGDIRVELEADEDKSFSEIADAPVAALQGVSEDDAQKLRDASNVTTVRDPGTNDYFLQARAFAKLAA